MRYHVVYFLDTKTEKPVFHNHYDDEKKAISMLSEVALTYVKNQQGKQQADIAIQPTKSVAEIQADGTLKEGLYIKQEGQTFVLYEKVKAPLPGFIYSSYEMKMNRVGKFDVTDIELDVPLIASSSGNHPKPASYSYIDELKKRLDNPSGRFGLRRVSA